MSSKYLALNINDFVKGLVVAILAAVFTFLAAALNAPGFDWATFNWGELVRIVVASAVAYLAKNFLTDHEGKLLGKI